MKYVLVVCGMLLAWGARAAEGAVALGDSAAAKRVRIVRAGAILRDPAVTGAQRLVGDVVLAHRDAELRCDSAWRYDDGRFRAMGRVVAERPGEWVMRADELEWDPVAERMDAFGAPVRFEEAELVVTGPILRYGWVDEVAWFPERAELRADGQSAVADRGRFEVPSGWLTLGGNVVVSGDGERVDSDSLRVHVEEGDVVFLGRSLVRGEDGEWGVRCERGEWGDGAGWRRWTRP